MAEVLSLVLPFFALIALGFVAAKAAGLKAEGSLAGLTTFIVYLALPALFFQTLAKTPLADLSRFDFVAATTTAALLAFLLAFAAGLLIERGKMPEATIQGLAGGYGNVGYLAPGLTIGAFGATAAAPTALVTCFDNTLMFTLAPLFMALGSGRREGAGRLALRIARGVLFHPFILATLAGFLAAAVQFEPPEPVDRMLTYLRQAAAPCALFAMGVTAAIRPVRRLPIELPVLLFAKLVFHPVAVYLLVSFVGDFDPIWTYSAVLMASLPTATNVFVLAQQYGVYVERASSTVVISTITAVVTVTLVLYLLRHGILPPDLMPHR
ncbi:MAG: AEC family transporter [Bauldia sp.]